MATKNLGCLLLLCVLTYCLLDFVFNVMGARDGGYFLLGAVLVAVLFIDRKEI